MPDPALVVVGLVLGAALAWLVARAHFGSRLASLDALVRELREQRTAREGEAAALRLRLEREQRERVEASARLEATRQNVEDQRRLLDEAGADLTRTFETLSGDALRRSNEEFLALAEERLGHRQKEIDASVTPLKEALARYEAGIRELEKAHDQAYGGLRSEVETLARLSERLRGETGNLVTALRSPQVRGRWGEITLHRVVELAGMTGHCDYVEQVTVERDEGRLRPDMIVRLPGGRDIVVDAKVPLAAYLEAVGASSDEERAAALSRHAKQVREHMTALAAKAYWEQFPSAPELVVMFIPGESFVGAAAVADPALIEDGMAKRVVVSTPTTLIALLRAIAYGWRQEQVAANAEQIRSLGSQLYDRLRTLAGHFDALGGSLARAVNAYNGFVGSMETRVLPAARRFRDLGATGGEEIPPLPAVEQAPRQPDAPEFPRQLTTSEVPPEEVR
ncbi:MAG: DNA recombination protein RmuC [Candidatus Rokuibacteriota bacterium]|nr:MAG: DNA recombination protein RmuC [Candidatus Rokubacteria bacterium]